MPHRGLRRPALCFSAWSRNTRIFESLRAVRMYWHLNDRPCSWFHYPKQFRDALPVVRDILQNMHAKNRIERLGREWHFANIGFHHCQRRLKGGAHIFDIIEGGE